MKNRGMSAFIIVWLGQFISIMGTSITKFALVIWAFEKTGSASTTALLGFSSILPYVLLSPIAGVMVDRYNKKKIMIFSDLLAGMVSLMILGLFTTGNLQVWHLFLMEALLGSFECFQFPAYISAITIMIPKEQYSRASGMRSFSSYASQVFAPILGGILVIKIGVTGILMLDFLTFLIGVVMIIIIYIPHNSNSHGDKIRIWGEFKFSIVYLLERRGLFLLMIVFIFMNLVAAMTYFGILPAMILARTGNDKMILAGVQAALGLGGVCGGLLVSIFGIPGKKILVMLLSTAISYLVGDILLGLGRTPFVWYIAAFVSSIVLPFTMGAQNALWQAKVEPNLQGRIFAIKGMLQLGSMPIGYLLGGVLADFVFEPAMSHSGMLAKLVSWIIPQGKGSGMALMFVITGVLGTLVSIGGYLIKEIRDLEDGIVDYDIESEESLI